MDQHFSQPTGSSEQGWAKVAWAVVGLALLVIVAIAIGSAPSKEPTPKRPTASPNAAPAAKGDSNPPKDAKRVATQTSFAITWAGRSESQRDQLCKGLRTMGLAQTAKQLQKGANGSQDLDWNYAAQLMQDACNNR